MRFDIPPAALLILALGFAVAFVWLRYGVEPDVGPWRAPSGQQTPARAPRDEVPVDPQVLAGYAGEYRMDGMSVRIVLEDGRLFASPAPGVRHALYAQTETRFFLPSLAAEIDFVVDERGAAPRFLARLPSGAYIAERVVR